MYKNKTFLALLPARGGSKRLPRKNILPLNGKPLISWSIDAGLKSEYIDKVVVSSDDNEILTIAKEWGAETLRRPDILATDSATTFDTVSHALGEYKNYDYIVLLQPTSPLRSSVDVDQAIELLMRKKADSVVSVSEMEHSPLWANTLDKTDSMEGFLKEENFSKRSQDLETYYRLNGAIYICKVDKFLEEKSFFLEENIFAYRMDRESSIDIDEKIDFDIASILKKV